MDECKNFSIIVLLHCYKLATHFPNSFDSSASETEYVVFVNVVFEEGKRISVIIQKLVRVTKLRELLLRILIILKLVELV